MRRLFKKEVRIYIMNNYNLLSYFPAVSFYIMIKWVCTGMWCKMEPSTVCITSTLGIEQANEVKYLLAAHGFNWCELWPRVSVLGRARAASVLRVWRVGGVCQPRLPLPHVPVQALGQALEPVVHQVVAADGGDRVTRCSDLDAVKKDNARRQ